VIEGVEQSLRHMRTDYLDLVQFHGRPVLVELIAGGAIEALQDLQRAGKVRFIGASATLPDLPDLIATGLFDEFQNPYSLLDRVHEGVIADAALAGAGTVIRGGAARGAPSDEKRWVDASLGVSEQRARGLWEEALLDGLLDGASRMEFTLRFTLSPPHLDTAIVGTSRVEHLRDNIASLRKGPLPADVYAEALRRLDAAAERVGG
jgi:aryl-alcohol dehydrogenase-like predicted oxidoreductase